MIVLFKIYRNEVYVDNFVKRWTHLSLVVKSLLLFQISSAALKASQVMKHVRVEHKEDLVVPFGVP